MSTVNLDFDLRLNSFSGDGFVLWSWCCLCSARGSASDVVTRKASFDLPPPPAEVYCAECGIRFTRVNHHHRSATAAVGLYTPEYAGGGRT